MAKPLSPDLRIRIRKTLRTPASRIGQTWPRNGMEGISA